MIPPDLLADFSARYEAWGNERLPVEICEFFAFQARVDGDSIVLFDKRGTPLAPDSWTECPFARLRYAPATGLWTLDWHNSKRGGWRAYRRKAPTPDLDELLAEVARDPTGIFLG